MGAGAPTWFGLLESIERQLKPGPCCIGNEVNWDPLAFADRLEAEAAKTPKTLKKRVCDLLDRKIPSLLACLLVQMKDCNIVTQNYDRLIESACAGLSVADLFSVRQEQAYPLSVIPYSPRKDAPRWLLKMHGCVSVPEDVVLTGKDYEHYESSKMKALTGLVQGNLMTR